MGCDNCQFPSNLLLASNGTLALSNFLPLLLNLLWRDPSNFYDFSKESLFSYNLNRAFFHFTANGGMSVLSIEKERERERTVVSLLWRVFWIMYREHEALQRLKLEDKTRFVDRWKKIVRLIYGGWRSGREMSRGAFRNHEE